MLVLKKPLLIFLCTIAIFDIKFNININYILESEGCSSRNCLFSKNEVNEDFPEPDIPIITIFLKYSKSLDSIIYITHIIIWFIEFKMKLCISKLYKFKIILKL